MMNNKEIPVLLLTGYLGSGKTTLVNHILSNGQGIKFAVIVNDLGEVNIDADLIQKGGVVDQKDDSLVALQNGCICCTLKMDLVEQLRDLAKMGKFDYIVIEASGICEPEPIARTIGTCRLDRIVTVVDALRMRDEFACGDDLARKDLGEEDIENLLIQQIEFCDMILLNKVSEVSPEDLARVKRIIRVLQPKAEIIECDYGRVDLDRLIETGKFNFERVATSAGWISQIERPLDELEEENAHEEDHHHHDEEHHHEEHHHHHHHHDEGEAEEYGISTFVYYRRPAFNIHRFDRFVATNWPKGVIRAKGICYFSHNRDMSFLFEQAGSQKQLSNAGLWYAAAPKEELEAMMRQEPGLRRDWDERYGDRMQKIVFIGQHLDKEQLTRDLDACLETVR